MSELRATILTALRGDAAEKLAKQLDGVSVKMTNFGNVASKAVKGVASLGAALVSSKFIGDSIEQAKNLERSVLALDSVFGSVAPRMVEFSKNAANMGLSQSEAAKASTFLGSVLQQYGFSSTEAANETEKLTKLSADLAATYGYDVQEALLAVTALFRGEYDPIEKFGVAMKQNEINAVRTARGLGDLTGAAEMQADAQIRLELLMERSTSAQGAMERGAGTLYVETEKLRATFENLQANLGQELIPVFAELFEKLRPIIEDSAPALIVIFEAVGEVIGFLADTLTSLFDPTTELGEEFMMLGNQFDSFIKTVTGKDFNLQMIFDGATYAVGFFIRALHDLIRIAENIVIAFQAVGIMFTAIFNRDWETASKGIIGISNELYAARDAAKSAADQMDLLYAKAAKSLDELGDQTEIFDVLAERAKTEGTVIGKILSKSVGKALKVEKDAVADFFAGLMDEIEKQTAKLELESLGASEGLINAILGSGEEWQKVFDNILARGIDSLTEAQKLFNRTGAGAAEQAARLLDEQKGAEAFARFQEEGLKRAEEQAKAAAKAYAEVAAQIAAVHKASQELAEQQKTLSDRFAENQRELFSAFTSSNEPEEQVGRYTQAVRELTKGLNELIEANPFMDDEGGLFTDDVRATLIGSVNNIGDVIEAVAKQRDSIATRLGGAKSLIASVADQILGRFSITELQGRASSLIKQLKRTVEQTRAFAAQVTQLRQAGLSEALVGQIVSAGAQVGGATAKALLDGGVDAVSEVNSLYSELGSIANQMGEETAIQMFGAGVDITNGLVEGLLAQQSEIEMAATQLATSFQSAFEKVTRQGQVGISAATSEMVGFAMTNPYSGTAEAGMSLARPRINQPAPVQITINAGLGTDPVALGREVTNAIKRYESVSGRVFASA